jgi:hypothetical protein
MSAYFIQSNRDNYMAFGDFTVTRASTKNVLGSAGTYVSVANNVPAFEFNADGSYRGLLVEPGATNLALQSQAFNEANWSKINSSVSANSQVAPDGATTADTLIEDNTSNVHALAVAFTVTVQAYTFSVFAKAGTRSWMFLQNSTDTQRVWFDLSNGVVGTQTGATGSIQSLPNGWYRCSITLTPASAASKTFAINASTGNGTISYLGDGTSGIFIWQAQMETGSVATSPIVTTGSTASRVADVVSLTGASSLIGQSAGTAFVEVEILNFTQANARGLLYLSDGTTNNRIGLQVGGATDEVQLISSTSGSTLVSITTNNNPSGIQKYAGAYALDDFVFYNNGVSIGTDTSATVPATSRIDIGGIVGSGQFNGWIRSVALFPTRLPNATLVSLTTP